MKKISIIFIAFLFVFSAFPVHAQEKSYNINTFHADLIVNKDTTVTVEEYITYDFTGEFNKGWRSISHKGISNITDVEVIDPVTGKPLMYSFFKKTPTDSNSWGYFTYRNTPSATNVEWYYNAKNEQKTWIIKYKVHGLIGFHPDRDEVYWNLFTDYDVPVMNVIANVTTPEGGYIDETDVKTSVYRSSGAATTVSSIGVHNVHFETTEVAPKEAVTIAVGWPKGILSPTAFWFDFIKTYRGYAAGLLLILASIIYALFSWFFKEKYKKGKTTIIPEYEPPLHLKPAQADAIINEGLSSRAWPATVIDLAIRGHVKIEEDISGMKHRNRRIIALFVAVIISLGLGFILGQGHWDAAIIIAIALLVIEVPLVFKIKFKKHYFVTRISSINNKSVLSSYETEFMQALFSSGYTFSTKVVSHNQKMSAEMYKNIQQIEKKFKEELTKDYPNLYEVTLSQGAKRGITVVFFVIAIFTFFWSAQSSYAQLGGLLASVFISLAIYILFVRYNPRLSDEGANVKSDIEGFRLYLKIAERLRLQNLKPETFEKYLPYAIIFGVEKEWSKAFDAMNMPPPQWYGGSYAGGYVLTNHPGVGVSTPTGATAFSPSLFSTSFTSSFSSAFSATGASGSSAGSSGGGSAGGGGGGGGGGAS